jgi:hypothetical protein
MNGDCFPFILRVLGEMLSISGRLITLGVGFVSETKLISSFFDASDDPGLIFGILN